MKTVFKRLISSLLLVVMLVAAIPASLVSAGADDIDWETLKDKYGLTDEQIDAAKDIADEYDLTQDQVDAVEDYYESLPPEEQEELKETVKEAVENGEIPELGEIDGDVAVKFAKAMFIATMKKAAKDILNRVLDAMEDVTVANPFGFDRVYDANGDLAGINFVLKSPEDVNIVDTLYALVDKNDVYYALAAVAGAALMFDEVSVNGYTVYDLADPSDIRNALVKIYRSNPIEFSTVANMEGNTVATYNFSLSCRGTTINLPVSFVIDCSEARLNQIKNTAKKLADLVEINGDFNEEDGIFSADLEGILDLSNYVDSILEYLLPALVADDYSLVREELHALSMNDFIDMLNLKNLERVAAKLGYDEAFGKLVNKVAAHFHLDTAEPNDVKALISVLDEKGLFPVYVKAVLQKAYNVLDVNEILNTTVGSLYNGDGSYSVILGNGIGPKGFDSYVDRVLNRLLNTKIEDRISAALKTRGYSSIEAYVDALKNRYNKIYTGKYDLDVTLTVILFDVYTVTFVDENGNVIDTQKVVAGDDAVDPNFHGGNALDVNYTADVDYDNVLSDLTVVLAPKHNYKVVGSTSPDCTTPGYATYSCIWCDDSYVAEDEIALGHSVKRVEKDPTCIASGGWVEFCTVCDEVLDYEIIAADEKYHNYIAVKVDATCTEPGDLTHTCTYCGDTYHSYSDALGHDWSDWTVIDEATCQEEGWEQRVCDRCDLTENRTFAGDHKYITTEKLPTCDKPGYVHIECVYCGESFDSVLAALGHKWNEIGREEPTHTEAGFIEYECTVCHETKVEDLKPLGDHDWVGEWYDATCFDPGYFIYTCECGASYKEVVGEPYGHKNEYYIIGATCTEDGALVCECVRCGEKTCEVIPATGHTYDDGVVTKEPTCQVEGVKTFTCVDCSHTYFETVATVDHLMIVYSVSDPQCEDYAFVVLVCKYGCGYSVVVWEDGTGHDWVSIETVLPDCGNDGYVVLQCSECGEIKVETIPATGEHDYVHTIIHDATCAHIGLMNHLCTVCGYEYETVIPVNPFAHSYTSVVLSDPDCTNEGVLEKTCIFCGEVVLEAIPALGHTFDYTNGVYVAPSCTTEGSITYTCVKNCGGTHVIVLPVIDHSWIDVHVDGTNCCNPSVDKKICAACGVVSEVTTTPVYYPTLISGTNNLSFLNNFLVVKIDKMTVGEFKANFSGSITVYDKNGKELSDSNYVGTNCTFVCDDCGTSFTVAVIGDIDGNGKVNSVDYMYVKRHVLKTYKLEGAMLAAADVNVDCIVNSVDYAMIKSHVMYRFNIYDKFPSWDNIENLIVSMPNPFVG